jgi:hypothetical protein
MIVLIIRSGSSAPLKTGLPDPSKKRQQPVFAGAGGVRVGFTGSRAQSATARRGW